MNKRIGALIAAVIVIVALVAIYVYFPYFARVGEITTTATTTTINATTTIPIQITPTIRNFSVTSSSNQLPSPQFPYLDTNATSGLSAVYLNATDNFTLSLQVITYSNTASMLESYKYMTHYPSANSTLGYLNGLPANSTGIYLLMPGQHQNLYTITSHVDHSVIQLILFLPSNENVSTSSAVAMLLDALNATVKVLP